jgi:hypothetical protein
MTKVNMESVKMMNNAKFSKEKTEELLKGLKDSGAIVGVEDLASYIRKSGLIVKESIGRKRLVFEMNPKFYGVNLSEKGESVQGFHKNHIKSGGIFFIPKEEERKLINLESSVRMLRRRSSIGYEDRFMPLETYEAFKEEFSKRKKEYFDFRDSIANRWSELLSNFRKELTDWLQEFNAKDREVLFTTIMSRVPTVAEYRNSFYMELNIKAFPVAENLDMFRDEIKDQIQNGLTDDTVATMYEIIGNTLNQAFETVMIAVENYKQNGNLSARTKGSVKRTAEMIAEKNIFANHVIDDVKAMMMEMLRSGDIRNSGEEICGAIFGYARELGIAKQIDISKCYLSAEELTMYYEEFQENRESKTQQAIAE